MMEKRKRGKNEKGEWRNGRFVWWRGMERGKLWISVRMRKNKREGEIHRG